MKQKGETLDTDKDWLTNLRPSSYIHCHLPKHGFTQSSFQVVSTLAFQSFRQVCCTFVQVCWGNDYRYRVMFKGHVTEPGRQVRSSPWARRAARSAPMKNIPLVVTLSGSKCSANAWHIWERARWFLNQICPWKIHWFNNHTLSCLTKMYEVGALNLSCLRVKILSFKYHLSAAILLFWLHLTCSVFLMSSSGHNLCVKSCDSGQHIMEL